MLETKVAQLDPTAVSKNFDELGERIHKIESTSAEEVKILQTEIKRMAGVLDDYPAPGAIRSVTAVTGQNQRISEVYTTVVSATLDLGQGKLALRQKTRRLLRSWSLAWKQNPRRLAWAI